MAENRVQSVDNEFCVSKKRKIDEETEEITKDVITDDVDEFLKDMSNFEVKKVLQNNPMHKRISIQGSFKGHDEDAVIVLEKKIFPEKHDILEKGFFNNETSLKKVYRNDIYRGYEWYPTKEHNGLHVTVTYPATKKHIEKYTPADYYLIEETPELYENVTLPQIRQKQLKLHWVDNILNGTAEITRVVYNDDNEETGFVLVKDLKWDDELQSLYLLAITRKKISCIRELNDTHLPLLKNIKEAGCKIIEEKYNIPNTQLRIFFHYQPTYYHLHVHFTTFAVENAGATPEKSPLLSTVISNIELMPDYYQKAVIPFRVPKFSCYEPYEKYLKTKETK